MTTPRYLADENLVERLILALERRCAGVDVVRVREVGLSGRTDDALLNWAAEQGRVILTHDARTFPAAACRRLDRGEPMAGVIVVPVSADPRAAWTTWRSFRWRAMQRSGSRE